MSPLRLAIILVSEKSHFIYEKNQKKCNVCDLLLRHLLWDAFLAPDPVRLGTHSETEFEIKKTQSSIITLFFCTKDSRLNHTAEQIPPNFHLRICAAQVSIARFKSSFPNASDFSKMTPISERKVDEHLEKPVIAGCSLIPQGRECEDFLKTLLEVKYSPAR